MPRYRAVAGWLLFAAGSTFLASCSAASASGDTPAQGSSPATSADAPAAPPPDPPVASEEASAPFVPAAHRAWPSFVRGSGHVLAPMRLVTIVSENETLASQLFAFGDAAIASDWWRAASAEYGLTQAEKNVRVTGPAIASDLDADGIRAYIADAITKSLAPAPNGNTLYLVYMPAHYEATGAASTAYHGVYDDAGDGFAVVSRAVSSAGHSELDELTYRASHEIIEAATNTKHGWQMPTVSATPWADRNPSIWRSTQPGTIEVGDLCERSRIREPLVDGFLFQRSWSNAAAARAGDPCVPARAEPYFNVAVPADWYPIKKGESITIPFVGWSTAATDRWFINVGVNHGQGPIARLTSVAGLTLATSLGVGTPPGCGKRQAVDNGVTGTLTVTAPPESVAGDYAVIWINNFREEPGTCEPSPDIDWHHFWPVGVHVE